MTGPELDALVLVDLLTGVLVDLLTGVLAGGLTGVLAGGLTGVLAGGRHVPIRIRRSRPGGWQSVPPCAGSRPCRSVAAALSPLLRAGLNG